MGRRAGRPARTVGWRLELPGELASVGRARRFAVEAVASAGFATLIDDAELCVSELATNAVVHARCGFAVEVVAAGESLRIEVTDGRPTAPGEVLPVASPGWSEHGRGLAMVGALATSWGVLSTGRTKTVWCRFEPTHRPEAASGSGSGSGAPLTNAGTAAVPPAGAR